MSRNVLFCVSFGSVFERPTHQSREDQCFSLFVRVRFAQAWHSPSCFGAEDALGSPYVRLSSTSRTALTGQT